jgi:hypothetical protein
MTLSSVSLMFRGYPQPLHFPFGIGNPCSKAGLRAT